MKDSCVCNIHYHQVYWRFDFDIGNKENNVVREFDSPPILPPDSWHIHRFETTRRRNPERGRRWQVWNSQTGGAYNLRPGADDTVADTFGRADVWILRLSEGEIDDGISAAPSQARASQPRGDPGRTWRTT